MYAQRTYNRHMDFEWDKNKASQNLIKHGIDFADVENVFFDILALTIEDPDAEGEHRFITIGIDSFNRLLVVVYTLRKKVIRIISARKATKSERSDYEQEN